MPAFSFRRRAPSEGGFRALRGGVATRPRHNGPNKDKRDPAATHGLRCGRIYRGCWANRVHKVKGRTKKKNNAIETDETGKKEKKRETKLKK